MSHTVGQDGVQIASMFLTGGIKGVAEGGEDALKKGMSETGDKIKNAIKDRLENIEKYFNTKEFADRVKDRLSKYKGALSQADWLERYKTLIKNREIWGGLFLVYTFCEF